MYAAAPLPLLGGGGGGGAPGAPAPAAGARELRRIDGSESRSGCSIAI